MVALADSDLRKILGENFREKQDQLDAASGLDETERDAKARIDGMQNQKSFVIYTGIIGLVLVVATKYSPTPTAMWIQIGIGLGVAALCGVYYGYLRSEVAKGLPKAATKG